MVWINKAAVRMKKATVRTTSGLPKTAYPMVWSREKFEWLLEVIVETDRCPHNERTRSISDLLCKPKEAAVSAVPKTFVAPGFPNLNG
jgi:hypothetical protein